MIPKIIHQIWIGSKKKPELWMNTFKIDYINKNPEYKYYLWTEENIEELFKDFPIYKIVYNLEKTYNGKSDILRYIILYIHGGIYVDADSVWINNKSFDTLLEQVNETEVFAAYEPKQQNDLLIEKQMCGGIMGSSKNNNLMKFLIQGIEKYVIREWQNNKIATQDYNRKRRMHGVCEVIGPVYMHRNLIDKNITIFPSIYFYPITWHNLSDPNIHKKMDLPKESYTFQYGYTTNDFESKI